MFADINIAIMIIMGILIVQIQSAYSTTNAANTTNTTTNGTVATTISNGSPRKIIETRYSADYLIIMVSEGLKSFLRC